MLFLFTSATDVGTIFVHLNGFCNLHGNNHNALKDAILAAEKQVKNCPQETSIYSLLLMFGSSQECNIVSSQLQ